MSARVGDSLGVSQGGRSYAPSGAARQDVAFVDTPEGGVYTITPRL